MLKRNIATKICIHIIFSSASWSRRSLFHWPRSHRSRGYESPESHVWIRTWAGSDYSPIYIVLFDIGHTFDDREHDIIIRRQAVFTIDDHVIAVFDLFAADIRHIHGGPIHFESKISDAKGAAAREANLKREDNPQYSNSQRPSPTGIRRAENRNGRSFAFFNIPLTVMPCCFVVVIVCSILLIWINPRFSNCCKWCLIFCGDVFPNEPPNLSQGEINQDFSSPPALIVFVVWYAWLQFIPLNITVKCNCGQPWQPTKLYKKC